MIDLKKTGTGPPAANPPEDDPVTSAGWDSFPASDPPGWMGLVSGEPPRPDLLTKIEIAGRDFVVDASVIGDLLGLAPREVPELMRAQTITSICERGEGADEGHYRLSFFYGSCRARLSVDSAGHILRRSVVDFGDRTPPRGTGRTEAGAVRVRPGVA